MIKSNGFDMFGYWEGMAYTTVSDTFNEFKLYIKSNTINKEAVIKHISSLDLWATSLPIKDIFTGENLGYGGKFQDGNFIFPCDFLHYYKNYDIGIPPEYERYLMQEFNLK